MPRPPRKVLLQPYYALIKNVATTGESITLTPNNLAEYGLRPVLSTALSNLRQVKSVFGPVDEQIAKFPLKIKKIRGGQGLVIQRADERPYAERQQKFHYKTKDHIYKTFPELGPAAFNAFFILFDTGYLKGHVLIKNASERLLELAREKEPDLCQLTIDGQQISLKKEKE